MNISNPPKAILNRSQSAMSSDRLVLRPFVDEDVVLLSAYASDKRVAFGTRSIPHPLPPKAADAYIKDARATHRDKDVWVIDSTLSGGPSMLGIISLKALDRNQSQIGYWVAPAFWHGGIASEAVRVLLAENPHNNRTVFAEVFQDNPVSARILTQAGFEYIGDAEAFAVSRNCAVPTWTYLRRMA
jgi:RimJ/RimL family protein N-acetyltransferase